MAGFASRSALVAGVVLLAAAAAAGAQEPEVRVTGAPYRPGMAQFSASSNEVQVGVLVRDSGGRAVGTLRRGDFRLYRDGVQEPITAFQVERARPAAAVAPEAGATVPAADTTEAQTAALFFDDNAMDVADLAEARQAAERLVRAGLPVGVRIGVFTASGAVRVNYTRSREALAAGLQRLVARPRMTPQGPHEGLKLSPYLAYMVTLDQFSTSPFLREAVARLRRSGQCFTEQACEILARGAADTTVQQATQAGAGTLRALLGAIASLRAQAGRRTLLLASSGFLNARLGEQQDQVEDAALRAGVTINALDAKMLTADLPTALEENLGLNLAEPEAMNDVMATLAEATGGRFVHNTNDLTGGLRRSLTPEAQYVLSFAPAEMPADGKFHKLRVRVAPPRLRVTARAGYYDPDAAMAPLSPATRRELDDAVLERGTPGAFPVSFSGGARRMSAGLPEVHAEVKVETARLPFVKANGRERDSLIWVTAFFTRRGQFVLAQMGRAELAYKPGSLKDSTKSAISSELKVRLAPGSYRVREVVREGNQGWITALTRYVEVP
ncbi:MAG: VWA domain-containing protein [Terriglobales bacterium]